MASIRPFKGIRPAKDKVHLVASRSVDSYKKSELNAKLAENPYTFMHVIKPDFGKAKRSKPGSPEQLKKIKARYEEFLGDKIFVQDNTGTFYIYEQLKDGNTYTGIIGCASINDYFNGVIKKHEQTLTRREEKLRDYLEVCDFNAEPVCLTYPSNKEIDATLAEIMQNEEPVYDYTTTDRVRHKLWLVTDKLKIDIITTQFKSIPAIYIADGHHRTASSALLGQKKRQETANYSGNEPFNFFLAAFFPDNQLKIFDFNRVVKDLNGLSSKYFIDKLSEQFEIEKKGKQAYKASKLHNFSMYLDGQWYSLTAKPEITDGNDPVDTLDASILSKYVLAPILNITDLKTDKRIEFISGVKGMDALQQQVDNGKMKVAFGLYPVSMKQLKLISDTNSIMPPKTTWVEPKLRSGLVIYSLSDK